MEGVLVLGSSNFKPGNGKEALLESNTSHTKWTWDQTFLVVSLWAQNHGRSPSEERELWFKRHVKSRMARRLHFEIQTNT